MQLIHTVTLVICISTALSFKHDIRQSGETTTNEIENSVNSHELENRDGSGTYGLKTYGGSGSYIGTDQVQNNDVPSTSAPLLPEDVRPMPTTGCFGHLPEENGNNNNVENVPLPFRPQSDPVPTQFNPQNDVIRPMYNPGFGPQTQQFYPHHHPYSPNHFPHHHHQHYPHNPWSPWRRNMPFAGPQQFYPQNPWSPWRRQMPFVMPPTGSQYFPQNGVNRPPIVIVKLLQPIILPVAKPFYPEGGDRDPNTEEIDNQKFATSGFQKYINGRSHRVGIRRFGGDRYRYEKSLEDKQISPNTYGPYKINGENVHISLKIH